MNKDDSAGGGAKPTDPSDGEPKTRVLPKGPLVWMANNAVASNLLMVLLVLGGILILPRIKQEVFPEFTLDLILVNIGYPGAGPAEVEQGVIMAAEEAVRGVDGIKEVRSTAVEGAGVVTLELLSGVQGDSVLADVKSAIDRVASFPQDIERPIVSLVANRNEVISLVVYGEYSEKQLRRLAEKIRDDLLEDEEITVVELAGVRPWEISVEIPQWQLRRYGLTLDTVANAVRQASVEVPGGGVKTRGGEILIRTTERRDWGAEYGDIVVLSRPDGSQIRLGDIANVDDSFRESDQRAYFNGKPAAMVRVYRVGEQTPISISQKVRQYALEHAAELPEGAAVSIWADWSEYYSERLGLLLRNAFLGLALVLLILGLFLEVRLAMWVTLGIPISFIGSLLFLPAFDASLNVISLFAFIVTLGIVVDDAIVVGESVYKRKREGHGSSEAAILGVKEVAAPVIFAVLTTVVAFAPMLMVSGPMGKFFRLIPIVVISVLLISLVESLLVLPAHLTHVGWGVAVLFLGGVAAVALAMPERAVQLLPTIGVAVLLILFRKQQQRFSRSIEFLIEHTYRPVLKWAIRRRYLTLALSVSIFLASVGLIVGGRVGFVFFPKVDGDIVTADLRMPFGTAVKDTREVTEHILNSAKSVLDELGGQASISRGIFSQVGASGSIRRDPGKPTSLGGGSHEGEVSVFLVSLNERAFTSSEFASKWREKIGDVVGVDTLRLTFATGPQAGTPIEVELQHRDLDVLASAAADVAKELETYVGVYDVDDGFHVGKEQMDFRLKPSARAVGLTETELARQVRSAFFGVEAVRQQRGRDELRVLVRLPADERRSEHDVEQLFIRTPSGGEIPLNQAVTIERGRSHTEINRRDSKRIVRVTSDLDATKANANDVSQDIRDKILPKVMAAYNGLGFSLEGEQRQQREAMGSLKLGYLFALVAIFALLAVAFRSYAQPLIIMGVIPFGLVGAVWGHMLMGYNLSLMSFMGVVALSGVVVNDSLILIVAVNEVRKVGRSVTDALLDGGVRRFRPIVLTSLTTFFGLVPMIAETSVQARFLIPMAISLGFGVLFATIIMLVLVPAVYAIVEDARKVPAWVSARLSLT